jgi:hypothetical protein
MDDHKKMPQQVAAVVTAWTAIPRELQDLNQWCYTSPLNPSSKAPLNRNGRFASVVNPADWMSFGEACERAAHVGGSIGLVLTAADPYCCIDLDVKDDMPAEWLQRHGLIVDICNSYTELSTGGRGAHVWVKAQVGLGRRRDGVEIYSQERFMISTGKVLRASPIAERQDVVKMLWDEMGRDAPQNPSWSDPDDAESHLYVAGMAFNEEGNFKSDELGTLFKGDWQGRYPSQSEADLALVTLLAEHTTSDRECWDAFRLSALGQRDKAKRPDYMRSTMAAARARVSASAASIAHGAEVARALLANEMAKGNHTAQSPKHFLLNEQDLFELPEPTWIVRMLVPSSGVGAIFGPSGAGKSFLVLDLLASIANGKDWFGFKVKKVPCIYVAFEGQAGLPKRVRAWKMKAAGRGMATSNMRFHLGAFDIRKPSELEPFLAALEAEGLRGGIVCFDTLAQAAPGFDENSSEGMGEVIGILGRIQKRLGGVVMAVHHTGKDIERGLRGWSGLGAALDFSIECARSGKDPMQRRFSLSKVKDDAAGSSYQYQMERVNVGHDSDGLPITSLAVAPLDTDELDEDFDHAAAQVDLADDEFVWRWMEKEIKLGNYPTGNSLEGQRPNEMHTERPMTQKRLRDAISRLKAASRVRFAAAKAPSGNKWLETVGKPTGGNLMDVLLKPQ